MHGGETDLRMVPSVAIDKGMPAFAQPVLEHMVSPVHTIADGDKLERADRELSRLHISALAVTDRSGAMVGVLSRTDLIRAGRVRRVGGRRELSLSLPDASVREHMTSTVEVVAPDTSLAEAARRMLRQHVHRLFVAEDRRPLGVVSTKEMVSAVVQARVALPIAELMHGSLVTVQANEPVALAVDRMTAAHHSGLLVLEGGWPVGIFTQADALAAQEAPAADPVESWMDTRFVCLPLATPVFRAGEQALATRARRVLAIDASGLRGVLTGMDFARLVQG
jgi:CBS domain-containing protein